MYKPEMINIPSLVRIKQNALQRIGIYLKRAAYDKVLLIYSEGLPESIYQTATGALKSEGIDFREIAAADNSLELAVGIFITHSNNAMAIIGLGGGKALDIAKYTAFLSNKPYFSIPTSLSNDGFCSPQSSLTIESVRKSMPSAMPYAVIVDTAVCLNAPEILWLSGVGDLASKFTAVTDWKLAFHATGEPVNDFSALLSDATVFQFTAHPARDQEGMRLLATALMLNGIAMSICGSSRPASGSEHLISHALDATSSRPRLHGLQVGIATYLISCLQESTTNRQILRKLFETTGFFSAIRSDPFSKKEWEKAIEMAPSMKSNFYTILSRIQITEKLLTIIVADPCLAGCFI